VHEWCDNELILSILVRNENELLRSLADNVILVVYPIKFIFNCLFYSGWIDSGTNRFRFYSVRVILGSSLHRVNKIRASSDSIRVISNFRSIRVITVWGRFGFGSVQFRISDRNRSNSFSCRFGSGFGLFGSGRSIRVTFARSIYTYMHIYTCICTYMCMYIYLSLHSSQIFFYIKNKPFPFKDNKFLKEESWENASVSLTLVDLNFHCLGQST